MTAAEKWARFGEGQLFSERTQVLGLLTLKSDYRFQPVSDGQDHRLPIFQIETQVWSAANLGCAPLGDLLRATFAKIEGAGDSAIFRHYTGRSQPLDSWQWTFAF
jgi:hypothetical protein